MAVLETAAHLHAAWWENESIRTLFDSEDHTESAANLVQTLFQQAWPRFIANADVKVPENTRRFGAYLTEHLSTLSSCFDNTPQTLTHGDFRLDNMLFDKRGADLRCWLIDWEDIGFGSAAYDVAWFIGGCLDINTSSEEEKLLRAYHEQLVRQGVRNYVWAEFQRDYRYAMSDAFVQGILMATTDKADSTYHTQLAQVIGRRFIHACERLHLHQLIEAD